MRPAYKPRAGDDARPKRSFGGDKPIRARSDGDRSRAAGDRAGKPAFRERPAFRGRDDAERPKRAYAPRDERPTQDAGEPAIPREPRSDEPERIAKVMARAGVASRRDSEAMILAGRVTVNGTVIDSPALDVSGKDRITVDGEMLPDRERTRLWLYHKPRGLVTTARDTEGRPTVFEALPEDLPRVITVGRLDINTEGLLLLTNDGGLARVLELPKTGWLRRYRVRAFGEIDQSRLDTLRDGIEIDGEHYGPVTARFEREQGANTWLTVDLREGKNREVKRVLEHLGLIVNRLIRVSFGPFQLGDLPEGEVDEIRMRVIKDQLGPELAAEAGVDFEAPRRDEGPVSAPDAPRLRRDPDADKRPARESRGRDSKPAERPERGPREERAEGRDKPWTKVVWRDPEVDAFKPKGGGGPRRGADPKAERAERAAAGTSFRKREAAVADPNGRRIQVERVTPAKAAGVRPPGSKLKRARREDFIDETGARRIASAPEAPDAGERKPWTEREQGGARPRTPRREGNDRPERPFRSRSSEERAPRRFDGERPGDSKPRAFRPRDDRPREDRPHGDRPEGGRSAAAKPAGGRTFGDKPRGGFGKPGGGKSGAGKPGGGRPGGGRPGGKPAGGRGGAPGRGGPGRGPRN